MSNNAHKRSELIAAIGLTAVVVGLAIVYLFGIFYYKHHVFPNTTIGGVRSEERRVGKEC